METNQSQQDQWCQDTRKMLGLGNSRLQIDSEYRGDAEPLSAEVAALATTNPKLAERLELLLAEAEVFAESGEIDDVNRCLSLVRKELSSESNVDLERFQQAWKQATDAWQQAVDKVDAQLNRLEGELKKSDDSQLREIGQLGLGAVWGSQRVSLTVALRELSASKPHLLLAKADQAQARIKDFRAHLAGDQLIDACQRNPFGIEVTVSDTLGGALTGFDKILTTVL